MDRVHSGKFVLRIPENVHRGLRAEAVRRSTSLNTLCIELLVAGLTNPECRKADIVPKRKIIVRELQKKFGNNLIGFLIFGSQVRSEANTASDIDLMIIVEDTIPLDRSLYRWWDETLAPNLPRTHNPQFVCLPSTPREAGGLWFEVAMGHEILWERDRDVSRFIGDLKEFVASGAIRRYITQGQPYWVWG